MTIFKKISLIFGIILTPLLILLAIILIPLIFFSYFYFGYNTDIYKFSRNLEQGQSRIDIETRARETFSENRVSTYKNKDRTTYDEGGIATYSLFLEFEDEKLIDALFNQGENMHCGDNCAEYFSIFREK